MSSDQGGELAILETQLARLTCLCPAVRQFVLAVAREKFSAEQIDAHRRDRLDLLEQVDPLLAEEGVNQIGDTIIDDLTEELGAEDGESFFLRLAMREMTRVPLYLFCLTNQLALPFDGHADRAATLLLGAAFLEREQLNAVEAAGQRWLRARQGGAKSTGVLATLEATTLVYLTGNLIPLDRAPLARRLLEEFTGLDAEVRRDPARLARAIQPEAPQFLEAVRLLALSLWEMEPTAPLLLLEAGLGGLSCTTDLAQRLNALPRDQHGSAYVELLSRGLLADERRDAIALVEAWVGVDRTHYADWRRLGEQLGAWLNSDPLSESLSRLWSDSLVMAGRLRDRALLDVLLAAARDGRSALLTSHLCDLKCVVWGLKKAIVEQAAQRLDDEQLARYLEERVALVVREIDAIDDPPFLELCRTMDECQSVPEVLQRLVPEEELDESQWMVAIMRTQDRPYRGLYCLANFLVSAVALPDIHLLAVGTNLAQALHRINRPGRAISHMQELLGLREDVCRDHARLRQWLDDWRQQHEPVFAVRNLLAKALVILGDALRAVGRADETVALLEELAGITPLLLADYGQLLVRLTAFNNPDHLGEDMVARYLRVLAEAQLALGLTATAASVLAASLGLPARPQREELLARLLEWGNRFSSWMLHDLVRVWQRVAELTGQGELCPALERADLFNELAERMGQLSSLTPLTSHLVEQYLLNQPNDIVERYLRGPLALIEQRIESCRDPRFQACCRGVAQAESWEEACQVLQLPADAEPYSWMGHAFDCQGEPGRVLLCVANHLAMTAVLDVAVPREVELQTAGLLAASWLSMGQDRVAAEILLDALHLDEGVLADAVRLAEWETALASTVSPECLTNVLTVLATALRDGAGALLLATHVGLAGPQEGEDRFREWSATLPAPLAASALKVLTRDWLGTEQFALALRLLRLIVPQATLDLVLPLRCLVVSSRAQILSMLHFWRDFEPGADYFIRRLRLIADLIEPLADPDMQARWAGWAGAANLPEARSQLGLPEANENMPLTWIRLAVEVQYDPARVLFCLGNHFAWPDGASEDLLAVERLGDTLRLTGRHALAVQVQLWPLQVGEDVLQHSETCRQLAQRLREQAPDFVCYYLITLADSLSPLGRTGESVRVLEGLLDFSPDLYADDRRLAKALAGLQEKEAPRALVRTVAELALFLLIEGRIPAAMNLVGTLTDSLAGPGRLDPARLATALRRYESGIDRSTARKVLHVATRLLRLVGRGKEAAAVWLGAIETATADLTDPAGWREWLAKESEDGSTVNDVQVEGMHLADTLLGGGEHSAALALLLALADLDEADLTDADRLGPQLRAWTDQVTPQNAILALTTAGAIVSSCRDEAAGVRFLDAWLDIISEDYTPQGLDHVLGPVLEKYPRPALLKLFRGHVQDLLGAERAGHALRLVEWLLGWTVPRQPDSTEVAAALERARRKHAPDEFLALVALLADALRKEGRPDQALMVLATELGETVETICDPARTGVVVRQTLAPSNHVALFGNALCELFTSTGHSAAALAVDEAILGLQARDYHDPFGCASVLERSIAHLEPVNALFYVERLARELNGQQRGGDALVLLEACLGLAPEHYRQAAMVRARYLAWLSPYTSRQGRLVAIRLVIALIGYLRDVHRRADSAILLECLANIDEETYLDPDLLGARLHAWNAILEETHKETMQRPEIVQWLAAVEIDLPTAQVLSLVEALSGSGRQNHAARVLETLLNLAGCFEDADRLGAALVELRDRFSPDALLRLVGSTAQTLRMTERKRDSLVLLEVFTGLNPQAFHEETTLEQWITNWKQRHGIARLFQHATVFAESLRFQNRKQDAVRLLEKCVGLQQGDYSNSSRLTATFEQIRSEKTDLAGFVHALAGQLLVTDRGLDAVRLLEAYLGMPSALFSDRAGLERTLARLRAEEEPLMLEEFATVLDFAGRRQDSLLMLQGGLGLRENDFSDPAALADRLRQWARQQSDSSVGIYLRTLGGHLARAGRIEDALLVLESHLGLAAGVYAVAEELRQRLREWSRNQEANNVTNFMMTTADVLEDAGRAEDGSRLLQAFLDLSRPEGDDRSSLEQRLRYWKQRVTATSLVNCLVQLGGGLVREGKPDEAVALLETDIGLRPADYEDSQSLRARLQAWTERLGGENNAVAGVHQLTRWLRLSGKAGAASLLLDTFVGDLGWLADPLHGPVPVNVVRLVENWLPLCGAADGRRAVDVCARTVAYLRQSLRREGMTLDDREAFVEQIGELRQQVLETVRDWADKQEDQEADRLRLLALLWDAELGQRLLLERFLLGRMVLHPERDDESPGVTWPFPEGRERPTFTGHRPAERAVGLVSAFGLALEQPGDRLDEESEPLAVQNVPGWYQEVETVVAAGLPAEQLARNMGQRGLLIRATFASGGELRWTAVKSDGTVVRIVGHDGGKGRRSDRLRAQRWAALHDLAIDLIYLFWGRGLATRKLVGAALARALAGPAARGLVHLASNDEGLGQAAAWWERFRAEVRSALPAGVGVAHGQARLALERASELLGARLNQLFEPPKRLAPFDTWAEELPRKVEELFALLRDLGAKATAPHGLLLDEATERFLGQLAEVWDLDQLRPHLDGDTEVVLQVDDALHAVPIALLPVGGERLFRQVRSLRSSISVLLDLMQGRVEEQARAVETEPGKLLTCTWFAEDDPAWQGGAILQHGQANLAMQRGLRWSGAALLPTARRGVLFRGLDQGAYRAVTVCGHGNATLGGVQLSDQLWRGSGHDLSGVDLLMLVSCSIGRLAQTGQQDVEGFSVELTLHRGRSALVCRWPVDALLAPGFANEVLAHFLAADPLTGNRGVRALALNRARATYLDTCLNSEQPGALNTVAAFELHGLG